MHFMGNAYLQQKKEFSVYSADLKNMTGRDDYTIYAYLSRTDLPGASP